MKSRFAVALVPIVLVAFCASACSLGRTSPPVSVSPSESASASPSDTAERGILGIGSSDQASPTLAPEESDALPSDMPSDIVETEDFPPPILSVSDANVVTEAELAAKALLEAAMAKDYETAKRYISADTFERINGKHNMDWLIEGMGNIFSRIIQYDFDDEIYMKDMLVIVNVTYVHSLSDKTETMPFYFIEEEGGPKAVLWAEE